MYCYLVQAWIGLDLRNILSFILLLQPKHWSFSYSGRDLTMKFWRRMGFITTGGPAVLGHAWNFSSVAAHHSLLETVPGVVPDFFTRRCHQLRSDWSWKRKQKVQSWTKLASEDLIIRDKFVEDVRDSERADESTDYVLGFASCWCCHFLLNLKLWLSQLTTIITTQTREKVNESKFN